MIKALISVILISVCLNSFGQYSRYIIHLKDKQGSSFSTGNPSQFLTQRSIDRRTKYHIAIDLSDLPVTTRYIDSIRLSGNVSIISVSKWLNQVCIATADAAAIAKINRFPFVTKSIPIAARPEVNQVITTKQPPPIKGIMPASKPIGTQSPKGFFDYGVAFAQVHLNNTDFLHNIGFKGEGMQLAIMDAGFYHYKTLPTFDSIRNDNQVLGTWDFVTNDSNVDEDDAHGMHSFSTLAANLPGVFVGTSPKASYYLFRTEDVATEYPVEEQNWAAAAEKADSLGADIFSVSLGYNLFDDPGFNYSYADMDGNTTIIAKAADLAAKKGILVVVAAGNEGNNSWKYITTPADADSVLAVGAVNATGLVGGFSSYGPSADGQIKPDIASVGVSAVVADQNNGGPVFGSGTSYACPIAAGMATCLWQAFPEVNNMAIIDVIRKSGNKANNPDNRIGYGIPDAKKAFVLLIKKLYTQQVSVDTSCRVQINSTLKAGAKMEIVVERKLPTDTGYSTISTIKTGGLFSTRNYNYADDLRLLAAVTNIKYRLKMNIGTDTSFYLDSAIINNPSCGLTTNKITVRPNPVNDNLSIVIARNNSAKAGVTIYSIAGQKVYSREQLVTGVQTISIPMKHLSSGEYILTLYVDGKKEVVKRFVKQ